MILLEAWQHHPAFWIFSVFCFSLIIGSFLNVVIYRLPRMLKRDWQLQCHLHFGSPAPEENSRFDLCMPRSHCPHCQVALRLGDNLPLLGFVLQKGRCRHCQHPISWRYPLVELSTAILTTSIAWHFGLSGFTLAAWVFTWFLLVLSVVDWDHQLLPDQLTLSLLWLGLLFNAWTGWISLHDAVIGAVAGYSFFWLVFQTFKRLTGKDGMGYGDFKLLAALGAWLGWQSLPLIVLLSSVLGAIVGLSLIAAGRQTMGQAIPYGPYLAIAGWVSMIFGDAIVGRYLAWTGL